MKLGYVTRCEVEVGQAWSPRPDSWACPPVLVVGVGINENMGRDGLAPMSGVLGFGPIPRVRKTGERALACYWDKCVKHRKPLSEKCKSAHEMRNKIAAR